MNTEKLKAFAKDLSKQPTPSPHEKLGGYVIAAHPGWRQLRAIRKSGDIDSKK